MNSPATSRASRRDVGRLCAQLERAGFEPREVEQLGGEPAQALDLRAHVVEELAAGRLVELLVLQQLEEAAEREQRRAQLVRGLGDELLARVVEALELALHVVERRAELAELVVGVGLDAVGEVAARDLARGALEPLDAQRQRARHQVAAEHRDQERDRAADEDPPPHQRDVGLHVGEPVGEHRDAAHAPALDQRLGHERLAPEPRRLGGARGLAGGERGLGDRLHVVDLDAAGVGVGEHEQRVLGAVDHAEHVDLRARARGDEPDLARELRLRRVGAHQPAAASTE